MHSTPALQCTAGRLADQAVGGMQGGIEAVQPQMALFPFDRIHSRGLNMVHRGVCSDVAQIDTLPSFAPSVHVGSMRGIDHWAREAVCLLTACSRRLRVVAHAAPAAPLNPQCSF
jgi:hypothetical protein